MRMADRQTALNTPSCARSIHGSLSGFSSSDSFDGPESLALGALAETLNAATGCENASRISNVVVALCAHGLLMVAKMRCGGRSQRESIPHGVVRPFCGLGSDQTTSGYGFVSVASHLGRGAAELGFEHHLHFIADAEVA